MNTRPSPIAPEVASRAVDLPKCPACEAYPVRVTNTRAEFYIHCPQCRASTHKTTERSARRQWCALVVAHD